VKGLGEERGNCLTKRRRRKKKKCLDMNVCACGQQEEVACPHVCLYPVLNIEQRLRGEGWRDRGAHTVTGHTHHAKDNHLHV